MSLWRVEQAADYLGIRPKTLYEWVRTGRVPHRKIGFNVRFDPAELADWVVASGEGGGIDQQELGAAAAEAMEQLRQLETELGEHLSFPQRRRIHEIADRLERALDDD
jgi:excisionase family DNA binding protein